MTDQVRMFETLNAQGEAFTVWCDLSAAVRSALRNGPRGWTVRDRRTGRIVWRYVAHDPAVDRTNKRAEWARRA